MNNDSIIIMIVKYFIKKYLIISKIRGRNDHVITFGKKERLLAIVLVTKCIINSSFRITMNVA